MIELLAVIVIMGILMVVAIPAVTRTIENTRKDSYLSTAKQYVNQVKTLWAADGLYCGTTSDTSATMADGNYFVRFSSVNDDLLEEGGQSPWKANTAGIVYIVRSSNANTYSVYIEDAKKNAIGEISGSKVEPVGFDSLARGSVLKLTDANDSYATPASGRPTANPKDSAINMSTYTECKVLD